MRFSGLIEASNGLGFDGCGEVLIGFFKTQPSKLRD
jgi:hypothetical protein